MPCTAFIDYDAGDPYEIVRVYPPCGVLRYTRKHYDICPECRRLFLLRGVQGYYTIKRIEPEDYELFANSIYDAPRWQFRDQH